MNGTVDIHDMHLAILLADHQLTSVADRIECSFLINIYIAEVKIFVTVYRTGLQVVIDLRVTHDLTISADTYETRRPRYDKRLHDGAIGYRPSALGTAGQCHCLIDGRMVHVSMITVGENVGRIGEEGSQLLVACTLLGNRHVADATCHGDIAQCVCHPFGEFCLHTLILRNDTLSFGNL